eukprot:1921584-Pyramimonas_sp.AAC.1
MRSQGAWGEQNPKTLKQRASLRTTAPGSMTHTELCAGRGTFINVRAVAKSSLRSSFRLRSP